MTPAFITGTVSASKNLNLPKKVKIVLMDPSTPHVASSTCWCHPVYCRGEWHHKSMAKVMDELYNASAPHHIDDILLDITDEE